LRDEKIVRNTLIVQKSRRWQLAKKVKQVGALFGGKCRAGLKLNPWGSGSKVRENVASQEREGHSKREKKLFEVEGLKTT
jgi:hypothetical protein